MYSVSNEIPILHIGYNDDYHIIVKELAGKFEGQFTCLGENNEKYITFSVSIKNVLGIDK